MQIGREISVRELIFRGGGTRGGSSPSPRSLAGNPSDFSAEKFEIHIREGSSSLPELHIFMRSSFPGLMYSSIFLFPDLNAGRR